jgi:Protein of unknown function (DUF742)
VSDERADEPVPESGAWIRPFVDGAGGADDGQPEAGATVDGGATLRPFLLTDGRVATDDAIAIETQVVTTELGRAECVRLGFERRDIVVLCDLPQSVAEIAASLSLHLGVVRVLVGDLSADGHLSVHLPDTDVAGDVDTLLRVIRGLRSIR